MHVVRPGQEGLTSVDTKRQEMTLSTGLELLKKVESLIPSPQSLFENSDVVSVEQLLRRAIDVEPDVARLRRLSLLLSELERHHRSAPDAGADGDSIRIEESPFEARLTLLPARREGRALTPEQLHKRLKDRGIVHGIRDAAVQAACACANRSETVYHLVVASGDSGESGEDGSVSFAVKAFDKRL